MYKLRKAHEDEYLVYDQFGTTRRPFEMLLDDTSSLVLRMQRDKVEREGTREKKQVWDNLNSLRNPMSCAFECRVLF